MLALFEASQEDEDITSWLMQVDSNSSSDCIFHLFVPTALLEHDRNRIATPAHR